ncbi:MAG TPA: bifunctional ornithine acetyltransferase/N-acetylglutamate synthase, partial [Acidimicrobiales bacterium]|nr:bifunctional ornithine acetyltransferase/N-acetylglutamate synthase [Acidimicrobiales bacterium]
MSVTAAKGFAASGVACGIKESGSPDLALVAADPPRPVPCAGVFTSNLSAAAPVVVSRSHLASSGGYAAAVLLNSGCANAATGERGHADALAGTGAAAAALGVAESHVLVCSTGLIGIPLPAGRIEGGIPRLVA